MQSDLTGTVQIFVFSEIQLYRFLACLIKCFLYTFYVHTSRIFSSHCESQQFMPQIYGLQIISPSSLSIFSSLLPSLSPFLVFYPVSHSPTYLSLLPYPQFLLFVPHVFYPHPSIPPSLSSSQLSLSFSPSCCMSPYLLLTLSLC